MTRPPGASDVLAILEAAYAGGVDENEWLASLVDATLPVLDRGRGVMAIPYRIEGDALWIAEKAVAREVPDAILALRAGWRDLGRRLWKDPAARPLLRPSFPLAPAVATFSECLDVKPAAKDFEGFWELPRPQVEFLSVIAGNPSGKGCFVTAATKHPPGTARSTWTRAERVLWTRIAVHIATGYRLVQSHVHVDAVLDPSGKVQHLEEEAVASRGALSAATREVDKARGPLRRTDPDRAITLWTGLVEGRWTLVDNFDHDGRRFVVARRNPPATRAWQTLTEAERAVVHYAAHGHSHKFIAYELGVTVATISNRLASAARKVGADSRLALVAAYRETMHDAPPPKSTRRR